MHYANRRIMMSIYYGYPPRLAENQLYLCIKLFNNHLASDYT